jgi:phage shock protein A
MALLERVATLVRANLNDLIDKAEDPEKMIKQVILDMENQLMQVKTQVAISIADQHMLEKKQKHSEEKAAEWMRKAELAVDKHQDDLARAALERHKSYLQLADSFRQQVADQQVQADTLKVALGRLEQKLAEAQAKSDMLIAQHRRARALGKAVDARRAMGSASHAATFDRLNEKVMRNEAVSHAKSAMMADDVDHRFAELEREDEVERLLVELKSRRAANASGSHVNAAGAAGGTRSR